MSIVIGSLLDGAKQATGNVAIIDVFRAFTTAAVALANRASCIIMVGSIQDALMLKKAGVGQICRSEVGGLAPMGFDHGNSPLEISGIDFQGKTIIQRTSAGTQGIVSAVQANRLYAASLVTANATAKALASGDANPITIVAMGNKAMDRADEDELCALHMRNILEGRCGNASAVRQIILASKEAARYGTPAYPHLPRGDLDIALDIDRYDFATRVTLEEGRPTARLERGSPGIST